MLILKSHFLAFLLFTSVMPEISGLNPFPILLIPFLAGEHVN